MNFNSGVRRPPTSVPGSRASMLSPSAPIFDAEAASRICAETLKYHPTDAEDDLAAQQAEQLPQTYATAKLVLRPLIPASGGLEPAYRITISSELHEKQMLHTADISYMYRQLAATRQYAGIPADPEADWAPDQVHARPAVGAAANPGPRRFAAPAPIGGAIPPLMLMPRNAYDMLPYDVAEPQLPRPLALPLPGGAGTGGGPLFLQQPAVPMVGASRQQPPHNPGPRRPQYGQRVLLQRLVPPSDGDVSYIEGLPYVNAYAAVERRGDDNGHTAERPHSHEQRHHRYAPYNPYGAFPDAVQRGPYVFHRAPPHGGPGRAAAAREDAERAALLSTSRGVAAAAELAAAMVRRDELYGRWTSGITMEAEGETEAGSESRGFERRDSAAVAFAAAGPPPAAAAAQSAGERSADRCGAGDLWNLEALADAACRAAELLEREEEEEGEKEGEESEEEEGEGEDETETGTLEAGCWSRGDGGISRRERGGGAAAEEPGRGGGRRQTSQPPPQQQQPRPRPAAVVVPADAAATGPGSPAGAAAAPAAAAAAAAPAAATGVSSAGLLPLTVFHVDRKCPKVLAPRSGRLGDTKHLVLPSEIAAALSRDVCFGARPICVTMLTPSNPAANLDGSATSHQQQHLQQQQQQQQEQQRPRQMDRCDMECQIGSGPGGFPALHVPCTAGVYGRPVRRFTLREDLVLELELGEQVVKPSRGGGGKRGAAAAEAEESADGGATANDAATDTAADVAPATDADGTAAIGSPREVCSSSPVSGKRKHGWPEAAEKGPGGDVRQPYCTPDGDKAPAGAGLAAGSTAIGTGGGSNVGSDAMGMAGDGAGAASPEGATTTTTTVPAPPAAAAGGGRRRGAAAALTLPIVVRRPTSGKPTAMRSCTGAVGSKKHLPLPNNIIKALPQPQRSGAAPVDVVVVYDIAAAASATAAPPEEERLSCYIGPTGSHGCTALQVPVSRQMNCRRLLHITLRVDLTIELGLGEVVEVTAAPPGRRRASAAATPTQASVDDGDDADDGDATEAGADGAASARQWGSGGGGDDSAAAAAAAPPPLKRRRSSSVSPRDSAAADAVAAAATARAVTAAPPPLALGTLPAAERTGSESSGSGDVAGGGGGLMNDANLRSGFEQFMALAMKMGYTMGRINPAMMVQQQQPPPLPPPPQQQQEAAAAAVQRRPHRDSATGSVATAARPQYPSSQLPPTYGMLQYAPQTAAGGLSAGFPAAEAAAPPAARRPAPGAPLPRGRPILDSYGRPAHLPYYCTAPPPSEDGGVSISGGGAAAAVSGGAAGSSALGERPEDVAAAAVLGRALSLLQQLPRAQLAAARASASASPEAAAVLGSFRSCLAGIFGLLSRAREAATADLAVQRDGAEALRADLLAAAPAMLNAAECLLEWYNLLAAAADERTAVSYATELASSAALVKAQLAHELAPLAVLVRA
ncbi:hypothetical protein PLESTF_000260000 [Pleodorina starrii]|nr:hypothetical protein PLESTF_000260000 [Pleodorina starrii]